MNRRKNNRADTSLIDVLSGFGRIFPVNKRIDFSLPLSLYLSPSLIHFLVRPFILSLSPMIVDQNGACALDGESWSTMPVSVVADSIVARWI